MRSLNLARIFGLLSAVTCTTPSGGATVLDAGRTTISPDADLSPRPSDGAVGKVICEETEYSREQFTDAFNTAVEALASEGYQVVPLTWEDEDGFSRLVEHMIAALDCTLENESSRRSGPGSCAVVMDLDHYQSNVAYCGPGARQEPCGSRVIPGHCLNEVCYRHDVCYRDLIAAQGPACIWSPDTEICDDDFYAGASACDAHFSCGFRCMLITTIAAQLKLLQKTVEVVNDEACVFGDDPDADQDGYSQFADNDCDDANSAVNPGAAELCGNRIDDDCDDGVDEGFADVGTVCSVGVGACIRSDIWACSDDYLSVVCPAISVLALPSPEICDGADNDCDGAVDEGVEVAESCQDGIFCNGEERCELGQCTIGAAVACDDGVECTLDYCAESARACRIVEEHTRCSDDVDCTTTRCTAVGCNTTFRHSSCGDGNSCTADVCTTTGCSNSDLVTLDADEDGFISVSCAGGTDCNDWNAALNPGAGEVCDGMDNNCNDAVDEGFAPGASCTNGLVGACERFGFLRCRADGLGTECSAPIGTPVLETCNGADDDCNGVVDDAWGCCPSTPCGGGSQCCAGECVRGECCSTIQCSWWDGQGYIWEICSSEHWCEACQTDADCMADPIGGVPDVCCGGICYVGDCCSDADCWYGLVCYHRWGVMNCNIPP